MDELVREDRDTGRPGLASSIIYTFEKTLQYLQSDYHRDMCTRPSIAVS
jgi:hypothetical protein